MICNNPSLKHTNKSTDLAKDFLTFGRCQKAQNLTIVLNSSPHIFRAIVRFASKPIFHNLICLNLRMPSFSSPLSCPSYCSRTSSPFLSNHSSLINGDPRRSLSFLSASPQGFNNLDELCVRSQRKSVQSSLVVQDGNFNWILCALKVYPHFV